MRYEDLPTNDEWDKFDWQQVFGSVDWGTEVSAYAPTIPTHQDRVDAISIDDVAELEAWYGYSPEGGGSVDLIALFRLTDGRVAWVEAWADYTGWGCQDDVTWHIGDRVDVFANVITNEQIERLGLVR